MGEAAFLTSIIEGIKKMEPVEHCDKERVIHYMKFIRRKTLGEARKKDKSVEAYLLHSRYGDFT